MNNTIIFLSLIILILNVMLVIKIKIILDVYNYKMIISICVFGLKILTIKINILSLKYSINNSKKCKRLKLIIDKREKFFLKQIKTSMIDKLYLDDVILQSRIGFADSNNTAITNGIMSIICNILSIILVKNRKSARFLYENNVDFNNKIIYFKFKIKVYFTVFDMIFAIIMSFYKRSKYGRQFKTN